MTTTAVFRTDAAAGICPHLHTMVWPTCLQSYQSVLNNERVRRLNDISTATLLRRGGGGGHPWRWRVLDVFPMTETREDNLENNDAIHWCGDVKREAANLLMHELCGCPGPDDGGVGSLPQPGTRPRPESQPPPESSAGGAPTRSVEASGSVGWPPPNPPPPTTSTAADGGAGQTSGAYGVSGANDGGGGHQGQRTGGGGVGSVSSFDKDFERGSVIDASAAASRAAWDPSVNLEIDPSGRWNFHSLGEVKPYRAADLETPGELESAAAARAHAGEIILLVANGDVADMVVNFALNLAALNMAHFLVVTDMPSRCQAFDRAGAAVAADGWIACGWTSYMESHLKPGTSANSSASSGPYDLDSLGTAVHGQSV